MQTVQSSGIATYKQYSYYNQILLTVIDLIDHFINNLHMSNNNKTELK